MKKSEKYLLIVDDIELNRKMLRKIFSEQFNILEACDGEQAINIIMEQKDNIVAVLLDLKMPKVDGYGVLKEMGLHNLLPTIPVIVISAINDTNSQIKALNMGATDVMAKPFNRGIVQCRLNNAIGRIQVLRLSEENKLYEMQIRQQNELIRISEIDDVTGIYNKRAFCRYAEKMIKSNPKKQYVIVRWDVDHFSMYNDAYGIEAGDLFLKEIGEEYCKKFANTNVVYGRIADDHFAFCMEKKNFNAEKTRRDILEHIEKMQFGFRFEVRMGVYSVDKNDAIDANVMCDRALIALRSIKDDIKNYIAYFDESMRTALLDEQQILMEMQKALDENHFEVYFQPQYNYETKSLCGAEALVRWNHPERGIIYPDKFIPTFEKNGFIFDMDSYVWETTCRQMRKWIDESIDVVPVSVNVSRRDIYNSDLFPIILEIVDKYEIPHGLIRFEITESAYITNPEQLMSIVKKLRRQGFKIEMDDFGSGYSSLNTLKDVPVDVLKLDTKFIKLGKNNSRGGSILSSVIRMAHWLNLPVIAEGVETKEQADYLKSLNCVYMQGFYFAKPMQQNEFEQILINNKHNPEDVILLNYDNNVEAIDFLDITSQATLLFNNFVGGAAIIEWTSDNNIEALRMNENFFKELDTNRKDYGNQYLHINKRLKPDFLRVYIDMLQKARDEQEEASCVTYSEPIVKNGKGIWMRTAARFLGSNNGASVYFISVENISKEETLKKENKELTSLLSDFVDSMPNGTIKFSIKNNQLETDFVTNSLPQMFGYSKKEYEEIVDKNPLAFVYDEDIDFFNEKVKEYISSDTDLMDIKYRHLQKDGSYKWVRIIGKIINKKSNNKLANAIIIDIDEDMNTIFGIKEEKGKLLSVINNIAVGVGIYECNENITPVFFDRHFRDLFGYGDKKIDEIIKSPDYINIFENQEEILKRKTNANFRICLKNRNKKNQKTWIMVACTFNSSKDKQYCYTTFIDITDTVKKEQKNSWIDGRYKLLGKINKSMTFDYSVKDDKLSYSYQNAGKSANVEGTIANYLKRFYQITKLHSDCIDEVKSVMLNMLVSPGVTTFDFNADLTGDGFRWYRVKCISSCGEDKKVDRVVAYAEDITDSKIKYESIVKKANTDGLTGLLNKDEAKEIVEERILNRPKEKTDYIFMMDIDDFKKVNDTYGHMEGDIVLQKISNILSGIFRESDIVSRFGGDEFLIYLCGCKGINEATKKAQTIIDQIGQIEFTDGYYISCSVGIASVTDNEISFRELFHRADYALYVSKSLGKRQYSVYDSENMGTDISKLDAWKSRE